MTVHHEKGSFLSLSHDGNNDSPDVLGSSIPFSWTHYLPKNGMFTYEGDISGTFIHRGPCISFSIRSSYLAFNDWPVHITVWFLNLSLLRCMLFLEGMASVKLSGKGQGAS